MKQIDYSTRQLNRLRRRILRVYSTARREMQEQLTEFLEQFEKLDAHKRELLEKGKITKAEYQTWLRNQVFQSDLMQAKLDNITRICTTAQQTAYKLARDEQYGIFAFGANHTFYELEQGAGAALNLTLYSTEAVKRLLRESPKLVPNKRIKSESNRTYDARVFNRYVLQGIIQGKSVHDIATQAVNGMADTEIHWAMNNAITALTGAQNAGALQQMRNAQALGIEVEKRWNSTLDYLTRETHQLLDQQTAPLDDPFEVEGYEIMYPGDPSADPEMVYHCRCKLTSFLPRYQRRNASRRDNVTGEVIPEQSYEEWYEGKKLQILQKLNYADSVPQTERETIEKELSILPQWQREKAESIIDKVVLLDKNAPGSGYSYKTKTLYVHPERAPGDMIHEYGHALEISLDLIHNKEYINIRRSGLELSDLSKIMLDSETFTEPVHYLMCDKFISVYQGQIYESPDFGIFKPDSMEVDESMLKEYFSEGYRAFYQEPDFLRKKDPDLYRFIEGLKNDKK